MAPVRRGLRPFWRYFGGKWRLAPTYPKPRYRTLVEPFAGAAGYALRHPHLDVVLVDAYPVVAGIWRYLTSVSPEEVLRVPLVECVDDLPGWVPQEARWLVGFNLSTATTSPRKTLSAGNRWLQSIGQSPGWTSKFRERVASQVPHIRHWKVIEGDYSSAPDVEATWFVDPPYQVAGKYYPHQPADFRALGEWCKGRRGQVVVCEAEGADWLPFRPHRTSKSFNPDKPSREVVWTSGVETQGTLEFR